MLSRLLVVLSLTGLTRAQLKSCTSNADCVNAPYTDGKALTGAGVAGTYKGGSNSSVAYCAQLNGTKACWPCQFSVDLGSGSGGVSNENCYTYNGLFTPAGVEADKKDTWSSISKSGCDVCDTTIPTQLQGGVEGTTCYNHEDCQSDHFCDKLKKPGDTCLPNAFPKLILNSKCDSPFTCEMGTDHTDCPHLARVCVSCATAKENGFVALNCDDMTPVFLKHMVLHSSDEMLAIYLTLILCTLVYPLWCLIVFILKNSTRCVGGAKWTWGMAVDMER